VTYAKSKKTITNILKAARILFVEKNYANITITDIAAQANVSTGALYHHFSSKEDVYLQMMHQVLAEIKTVTEEAAQNSTGSCRERLHRSVLSFFNLSDEHLGALRLVRRDINIFADPMRHELIRAYQAAIPEQVETIFKDGIANGELQAVNTQLLSWQMVAIVEVTLHPNGRSVFSGREAMAHYLTNLFLDGIAIHDRAN
jgi:AcrR family transcriptional regulator